MPEQAPSFANFINHHDDDRSWQDQANCRGVDPDLFFPERGQSVKEARAVCHACVVRQDCLEFALVNGEKVGVWGGLTERERRRIRSRNYQARRSGSVATSATVEHADITDL